MPAPIAFPRTQKIGQYFAMCHTLFAAAPILMLTMLLSGCASLAMTAAGVGGGMAVSHELNGRASRTFTAPLSKVRAGIQTALRRMAIKPGKTEKTNGGETILAAANERRIQIEIKALSSNTTRVVAVARTNSGFVDAATALEIINQTEIAFAGDPASSTLSRKRPSRKPTLATAAADPAVSVAGQ